MVTGPAPCCAAGRAESADPQIFNSTSVLHQRSDEASYTSNSLDYWYNADGVCLARVVRCLHKACQLAISAATIGFAVSKTQIARSDSVEVVRIIVICVAPRTLLATEASWRNNERSQIALLRSCHGNAA